MSLYHIAIESTTHTHTQLMDSEKTATQTQLYVCDWF